MKTTSTTTTMTKGNLEDLIAAVNEFNNAGDCNLYPELIFNEITKDFYCVLYADEWGRSERPDWHHNVWLEIVEETEQGRFNHDLWYPTLTVDEVVEFCKKFYSVDFS